MNDFQERLYLIFTGIFIASLVACNLIFQKFFTWNFLGLTFELSVGIIAYPLPFWYRPYFRALWEEKSKPSCYFRFLCKYFYYVINFYIDECYAADWSPVDSATFNKVFGLSAPAFLASMMAYLTAQFIDVRIFHFWKRLTKGKHLWLRNNASTMFSQLVDTSMVLLILCSAGAIGWERFGSLLLMGWLFKVIVAAVDTPIIYFLLWLLKDKIRPASYLEEK